MLSPNGLAGLSCLLGIISCLFFVAAAILEGPDYLRRSQFLVKVGAWLFLFALGVGTVALVEIR